MGNCAYSNLFLDDLAQSLDLPIGFIARPFIESRQQKLQTTISMHAKDVNRCEECHAYINPYCDANATRWYCSLCGRRNNFDRSHVIIQLMTSSCPNCLHLLPCRQDISISTINTCLSLEIL